MLIPSESTIYNTLKGVVIEKSKTTFRENGLIGGFLQGVAFKIRDLYDYLFTKASNLFWLDRLTYEELVETGKLIGITPLAATKSKGFVNVIAPLNTVFERSSPFFINSFTYLLQSQQTSILNSFNINVSRSGTLATAVSSQVLNFATGLTLTISGFSEGNFNKTTTITALSDYSFSYAVDNVGLLSDSNGVATFEGFISEVLSQETGLSTEQINATVLLSEVPQSSVIVSFNGLTGGTDAETRDSLLTRLKDFAINNRNNTTNSKIINFIKKNFPQITTGKLLYGFDYFVNVSSITIDPLEDPRTRKITTVEPHKMKSGQVFELSGSNKPSLVINSSNTENRFIGKVYDENNLSVFVNNLIDTDTTSVGMKLSQISNGLCSLVLYKQKSINKSLTSVEIENVEVFLEQNISATSWYRVLSALPSLKTINVSSILPNIQIMKDAISQNLRDYFADNIQIGAGIKKSEVENVIINTQDRNGNKVIDFNIDMVSDFTVSQIEILEITVNTN